MDEQGRATDDANNVATELRWDRLNLGPRARRGRRSDANQGLIDELERAGFEELFPGDNRMFRLVRERTVFTTMIQPYLITEAERNDLMEIARGGYDLWKMLKEDMFTLARMYRQEWMEEMRMTRNRRARLEEEEGGGASSSSRNTVRRTEAPMLLLPPAQALMAGLRLY